VRRGVCAVHGVCVLCVVCGELCSLVCVFVYVCAVLDVCVLCVVCSELRGVMRVWCMCVCV